MDSNICIRHKVDLERMLLDGSTEPACLALSLLEDITNCFSDDAQIGSGGFAVVYKGMVGKGMVAVKKLSNTYGVHENKFYREVECLMKVKHKNIVRFLGYCSDTQGRTADYGGKFVMAELRNWLLCFEYVPNGSLDKYITDASRGLEWKERYKIIKGICMGLLHLHEKRIIHLDLKPGNILMGEDMVPKIADFGLSRRLDTEQTRASTLNPCGSMGYLALESFGGKFTFASDIYSLGIIIVEILTGEKGYPKVEDVVKTWMNRLKESDQWKTQLEQLRVCIKIGMECMDSNPEKRPAAHHINDRLDKTAGGSPRIGTAAWYPLQMGSKTNTRHKVDLLERVLLDGNAEPIYLPLSLLEDITNCFSEDQEIGRGGFAMVYKGRVGKGLVAVKKLSETYNISERQFHQEVECLMMVKHKNIVRFLGYCSETHWRNRDNDGMFAMAVIQYRLLCFEYVPNRSLDNYITDASRGLQWRERYEIIKGICEGLFYLHEKRILHLDLKPSNILLDDYMVPKISDFGLSRRLDKDQTRILTSNILGTLGYLAPELFRGELTFASDIYSLGVIIVEILTGQKGYPEDDDVLEFWMNRLEGTDQWEVQLEQVRVCIKIGIECMDSNPKKRPVAHHITNRIDKTPSTIETGISSSPVEQQVSFLKDQYCQEKIAKLSSKCIGKDIKEHAETEELVQYVATPREEASGDQWSLWGLQDTKQNVIPQGASISSSNSGLLYKLNNLDIFNKKARRNYVKYGGPTLEKIECVEIFRRGVMKPILKDENLLGRGPFAEVYLGIIGKVPVVVKKHISGTMRENDRFVNEAITQSQLTHKNIVSLIGCCVEVDNPMLVYEFFSKHSLHEILHSNKRVPLNLSMRVRIAAESAGAIAYMHSAFTTKILHGDVKSANILLDDQFVPKISDFGISRFIALDCNLTRMVTGDMSYMDPVYLQTGVLTEQSDVYNFGVVMLELLTRRGGSILNLVNDFLDNHKQGWKEAELFDKEIVTTEDLELLDNLAKIAVECLDRDVRRRPKMVDVAERLSILNQSRR